MTQLSKFYFLLTSFILVMSNHHTLQSDASAMSPLSMGPGGLIPQPTEEEMRYIMEEFLPSLSEEELKELEKLGQDIMDTVEKEGIPLWQPPVQTTPKQSPETPAQPIKEVLKEKPTTKKAAPTAAKKRLTDLITIIDSIRQKASSDQELEDNFAHLDKKINSLLYYLHVLNDDKLVMYLIEAEFASLNSHLQDLRYDLETLDIVFIVPKQEIHQTKKEEALYEDALKKAQDVLKTIIQRFNKAFDNENIIIDIEKLLKKYEPEALKIKKELDAAEKKAEQFIKGLPKTNVGGPKSGTSGGYPGSGNSPRPTGTAGTTPPRVTPGSTTSRTQEKPTAAPSKPDTKKAEPKKTPPTTGKVTIASLEADIKYKLDELENYISPFSQTLTTFINTYKSNKTEDATLKPLLQHAHFKAKRLKKDVEAWSALIDKGAKDFKNLQNKKLPITQVWNSKFTQPKLKNLYNQMENLEKNKVPLQGELKNLYTHLKKIEEKILEI
ncbi:hypothetical protein K9K77_00880 [Candidatus Babeliales bacterium]|nr:hypothetical protein [Candidatus Babeliales bacterium]